MPSYQENEVLLKQLERKINFVMKSFTVTKKEGIIDPKITTKDLLTIYNEAQAIGFEPEGVNETVEAPEQGNG